MSPEAQRIAIAESVGWTEISDWSANGINGKHPTEPWVKVIPDYLNDLNAMHEVEKTLTDEQRKVFVKNLNIYHPSADIHYPDTNARHYFSELRTEVFSLVHTTAAQRAEAYLRTIGKWEGGADE